MLSFPHSNSARNAFLVQCSKRSTTKANGSVIAELNFNDKVSFTYRISFRMSNN